MPYMKCPKCNYVLEPIEVYDGEIGAEKREENWYGRCPVCHKEYHWTCVFVFKSVVDFGEVKEEDE